MKVDVNEVLSQIAKAFNVAVEELYPILYKQAIISGISSLMWATLFISLIGAFVFSIRFIVKKQKEEEETCDFEWDWDEPRQVIILIVGITVTIIGLFIIPLSIESAIATLFNPDYYVLKDILKQLK